MITAARLGTKGSSALAKLIERRASPEALVVLPLSKRGFGTPTSCACVIAPRYNGARRISGSCLRHEAAEKQSHASGGGGDAAPAAASAEHRPPLPVRIALVSTTTALATPSFPALGFLYLVLRVTVPDANLRKVMEGRWGSLLSFTTWTLLPKLYHGAVASVILPCAVGNAIVAGGVYGLVDLATGGPSGSSEQLNRVLATPWITGSGIGATVGYFAPNYLYGPLFENMYAMEGMTQSIGYVMSVPYATEVSVVTGAVAGMLLHPLLYYPMNGVPGLRWGYFSGAALLACTSALVYVYYGREQVGLPVPDGSFIEPSQLDIANSIVRFNNATGDVETYSLTKQMFIGPPEMCLEGRLVADSCRSYAESGKVVFDDRVLAFVYNYWDGSAVSRYPDHTVEIETKERLQLRQKSMALTDATAAAVLQNERFDVDHANDSARSSKGGNTARIVLDTIEELSSAPSNAKAPSPSSSHHRLDDVIVATELLMLVKRSEQELTGAPSAQTLESFIRRHCPELTLHTVEEEFSDASVESQLRIAGWKEPEYSEALSRWKMVEQKEARKWRNRILVVAAGAVLTIAGSFLQGGA